MHNVVSDYSYSRLVFFLFFSFQKAEIPAFDYNSWPLPFFCRLAVFLVAISDRLEKGGEGGRESKEYIHYCSS